MQKAFNNYYLLSAFSLVIFFATACIAAFGQDLCLALAPIIYCCFTIYLLSVKPTRNGRFISVAIITIPILVFLVPVHFISFRGTLVSLPSTISFFYGIVLGIVINQVSLKFKVGLVAVLLTTSLFMYLKGFDLWLNKLNFGTYFLSVNEQVPSGLILKSNKGDNLNYSNTDKIIVLDFWNTGCGICFQKFPILQRQHDLYSKTNKIQFYAVNVPLKRDTMGQGYAVFKSLNYSVNNLNTLNMQTAVNLGVNYYPTVLIIYKNRIIYRGDIEHVDSYLNKLL